MNTRKCSDCGAKTEWKDVEQEYEREGIRIRLCGIPAMVCPLCESISFPMGVSQKIVEIFNAIYEIKLSKPVGLVTIGAEK